MRTTIFSIALAALTQLSAALPAPDASPAAPAPSYVPETLGRIPNMTTDRIPSPEKRAITHLYICDSSNFRGRCQNLEAERNRCCE